jgi:histidine kinase/histidine kinase/DNA gyrase B/HSP90-like ATPase
MSTARPFDEPPCLPGRDGREFHPLEAIPFFRRFPPGPVRNVVFSFIFNGLIGSVFWLLAIADHPANLSWQAWVLHLMVANVIGYTIHAFFGLGSMARLEQKVRGPWMTTAYYTFVSLMGVLVGFAIVARFMRFGLPKVMFTPEWLAGMATVSLIISAVLSVIFFGRARSARAEAALQAERLRTERIEREAALANLRALQAQIEPHFLFNTLANVTSLIDPQPATAKRMLESFIRFLRASLAATRTQSTTLAMEGELIRAYLDVLQVRMAARLRYRVEVPAELASFALPPMLLQPVVENAIGHGLEPKVEGGEVELRAMREPGGVAIEVADTGVGFGATTRGGVGLANLRDRLQLLYGDRASLEILENRPCGTRVRIRLPE